MKLAIAILALVWALQAQAAPVQVIDLRGQITVTEGHLVSSSANFDVYTAKDETNFCTIAPTAPHIHVLYIVAKNSTGKVKEAQETVYTEAYGHSNAAFDVESAWITNPGQPIVRVQLPGMRELLTNQKLLGTDLPLATVLTDLCK